MSYLLIGNSRHWTDWNASLNKTPRFHCKLRWIIYMEFCGNEAWSLYKLRESLQTANQNSFIFSIGLNFKDLERSLIMDQWLKKLNAFLANIVWNNYHRNEIKYLEAFSANNSCFTSFICPVNEIAMATGCWDKLSVNQSVSQIFHLSRKQKPRESP